MFFLPPPPSSGYPQYTRARGGFAAATRRQLGATKGSPDMRRLRGGYAAPQAGSPDIRTTT